MKNPSSERHRLVHFHCVFLIMCCLSAINPIDVTAQTVQSIDSAKVRWDISALIITDGNMFHIDRADKNDVILPYRIEKRGNSASPRMWELYFRLNNQQDLKLFREQINSWGIVEFIQFTKSSK